MRRRSRGTAGRTTHRLRISAALGVAALLTAATACSSSGGSGTTSSSASASVTVGLLFPYSGPAASYGALFNKAVQAGLAVVKDRYGSEITLKTVQEDSQNTAQGATTAMTALATVDGAQVVLSSGTAPGLAAMPIAKRYGIPLINGSAADPKLADSSGAIINLAPLANQQVAPLIPYVVSTKGLKRIAIIHTTDELGDTLDSQVKSAVAAAGGTVVTDLSVSPDLTNFSVQAALIAAHHPQAIYLADSVGVVQYAPIFKQFRAAGMTQTFLGFNGLHVPQVMTLSGVSGTLLVDQLINLNAGNWATTDFNKAWATIDPSVQATSYIVNYANSVILVGEAVHALLQAHQAVNSKSIESELHSISPATVIGGTTTISSDGTTNVQLAIYELTGAGKSVVVQSAGQ
jgi:ABC-type branched-subunit amino acid transport system substrate-binding protein